MDATDGRLLDAFENAFPDTGFVFDAQGMIVRAFAGPEVDRLVGDDPGELVGTPLGNCFDDGTAEALHQQIDRTLETQRLQTREYVIGGDTGTNSFDARMAPVATDTDERLVAAIFRDVSTRDLYAKRLDENNRILRTIRESTQAISRASTVSELHDSICDVITNSSPYQFAWVGEYDEGELVPVTTADGTAVYVDALNLTLPDGEDRTAPAPAVAAGGDHEPHVVPNLDNIAPETMWYDHARREGFRSIGAFPILDEGELEGVLTVYAERPYAFGFNERQLFTELCRDIRDAKNVLETQQRVQEQQSELEARNVEWEVLNRIVRHDIRNKMTVVRGRAELLADDIDDDQRHLQQILDNSERVIDITKEARQVAKTLAETDEIELEPVELAPTLEDEIGDLRDIYPDATVTVDGDLPTVTVAANEFLSSLFRNVLTNAVVHNQTTTPAVEISAERTDESVVVDIADDGPGIPADVWETAFEDERFVTGDDGHGVGLYLVNSLVSQYGGDIDIDTDGSGTAVAIELPLYGRQE